MKKYDYEILEKEPVGKLLIRIATPISLSYLVTILFYVVDAFFIGRWVGVNGIGAVSLMFPLIGVITAFGQLFSNGAASIISRKLGEKKMDVVNATFFQTVGMAVVTGTLFAGMGLLFKDQVLTAIGAKGVLYPYTETYFSIIIWSSPLMILTLLMNSVINSEGNAKKAFQYMSASMILNMILDPIFMGIFKMGIGGAAIATIVSQVVWILLLINYFLKLTGLNLSLTEFTYMGDLNRDVLILGFPMFSRTIAGSLTIILINNLLVFYGGEIYVATLGVIMRILRLFAIPLAGLAYGMKPIVGYNYGQKNCERAQLVVKKARRYVFYVGMGALFIVLPFAGKLLGMFSEELVTDETIMIMRIVSLVFPLVGLQSVGGEFFSSIGKAKEALIISLSRQVIFLIPLILVFSNLYEIIGIFIAFPIADTLSYILAHTLIKREFKKWRFEKAA